MRVCHTVFQEMPPIASWEEFAAKFPTVTDLLNAQQRLGLQLSWIAPSSIDRAFVKDAIKVRFVSAGWDQARRVAGAVAEESPEVVHQHGLNSWRALHFLNQLVHEGRCRYIVQDHGGGIPSFGLRRRLYRKSLETAGGAVFGDSETRDRWVNGEFLAAAQCRILFAASSTFSPASEQERDELRHQLEMEGRPILGWVAHLDSNKDPLTILRACENYFARNPDARLYMHFIKDDLLTACKAAIANSPALRDRVFPWGEICHRQLESFYRAIDYLVQGSHHEAYGYSVVEAMSTAAIPIVTDIPSFRLLCDDGRCGYLFPPGDAVALQRILETLPQTAPADERSRVLQRFEDEFSYAVVAEKLLALYNESLSGRIPCA